MPTSDQIDPAILAAGDKLVPGFADYFQASDSAQVMNLLKQAADQYGNISLPKLKEIILQSIPPTALAEIRQNPQYKAEQAQADAQLGEVINSGGLTLADQAALNNLRTRTGRATGAANNAVTQGMAARGTLDSGAQLAAELSNNQSAAQNESELDATTAGQAQTRALQAIQQRGQNATNNLATQWNEDAQVAAAKDAIARGNTAIANAGTMYNAELPQRNFENQLQLAGAKSGALKGLAGAYGASAKDQADLNINNDVASGVKTIGTLEGAGGSSGSINPGTSNASTQQAETSQSTKPQNANPMANTTGEQGASAGGNQSWTAPDGSVFEYAGTDELGLPKYRRHAPAGQNF